MTSYFTQIILLHNTCAPFQLTAVNDRLGEVSAPDGPGAPSSAALIHTLQRHKEILQDYKQEFSKTKANWRARREREDLLRSVRKDIE